MKYQAKKSKIEVESKINSDRFWSARARFAGVFGVGLMVVGAVGCAPEAQQEEAPQKSLVSPVAVQERQEMPECTYFDDIKFFLFKPEYTSSDAALVIANGKEIDRSEDRKILLQREEKSLEARIQKQFPGWVMTDLIAAEKNLDQLSLEKANAAQRVTEMDAEVAGLQKDVAQLLSTMDLNFPSLQRIVKKLLSAPLKEVELKIADFSKLNLQLKEEVLARATARWSAAPQDSSEAKLVTALKASLSSATGWLERYQAAVQFRDLVVACATEEGGKYSSCPDLRKQEIVALRSVKLADLRKERAVVQGLVAPLTTAVQELQAREGISDEIKADLTAIANWSKRLTQEWQEGSKNTFFDWLSQVEKGISRQSSDLAMAQVQLRLNTVSADLNSCQQVRATHWNRFDELQRQTAQLRAPFEALVDWDLIADFNRIKVIRTEANALEEKSNDRTNQINQVTEIPNTPKKMWIYKDLTAETDAFDPQDGQGQRKFTSQANSVRGVLFYPRGVGYEFQLLLANGNYYQAKIYKNRYGASDSGREYFSGDLWLKKDNGETVRAGLAKISGPGECVH